MENIPVYSQSRPFFIRFSSTYFPCLQLKVWTRRKLKIVPHSLLWIVEWLDGWLYNTGRIYCSHFLYKSSAWMKWRKKKPFQKNERMKREKKKYENNDWLVMKCDLRRTNNKSTQLKSSERKKKRKKKENTGKRKKKFHSTFFFFSFFGFVKNKKIWKNEKVILFW